MDNHLVNRYNRISDIARAKRRLLAVANKATVEVTGEVFTELFLTLEKGVEAYSEYLSTLPDCGEMIKPIKYIPDPERVLENILSITLSQTLGTEGNSLDITLYIGVVRDEPNMVQLWSSINRHISGRDKVTISPRASFMGSDTLKLSILPASYAYTINQQKVVGIRAHLLYIMLISFFTVVSGGNNLVSAKTLP